MSEFENRIYCPICARYIFAENDKEVSSGEHESYIFVHDDIEHNETDIEALNNNIN